MNFITADDPGLRLDCDLLRRSWPNQNQSDELDRAGDELQDDRGKERPKRIQDRQIINLQYHRDQGEGAERDK